MQSLDDPEAAVTQLRSKFPEQKFEICKPLPFILEIMNIMDDVILCYNVKQENNRTELCNSSSVSTVTEGISYGGNPLDVPSCLEVSLLSLTITDNIKPTYHYYPLSSHQALRVKGFYNLKLKVKIPIVILCAGEVKLLENGVLRSVNRVLHFSSFSGSQKHTGWSDYYSVESSSAEPLFRLLEKHSKKVSLRDDEKKLLVTKFKAKSMLKMINDANNISEKCSLLSAQFEWASLSIKPPVDLTDVSLLIDVNFSKSPTVNLGLIWKQLIHIQNYLDYLEKNNNSSPDTSLPSASSLFEDLGIKCELNEGTANEEMLKLILLEHGNKPSVLNEENLTLMVLTDFCADLNNSHSDLTSALWTKLLGCDSYKLLHLCFKHFIKHVRSSTRSIKKANITRLAQMIRPEQMFLDSYVNLINPVEYLVEIGLEKLRQVFMAIFDYLKVSSSVINMPILPKFPEVADSEDWMKVSKSWLAWLTRLYSSLNVLCCVEMALGNPEYANFYPVICKVVSQFSSNDSYSIIKIESLESLKEKSRHTISLKIPMTLLSTSTVNTDYLDEWSLTISSSTKTKKIESVFYRSPFCPIPYINEGNNSDGSEPISVRHLNTTYGVNTTLSHNMTDCLDNMPYTLHCFESHKITENYPFPQVK